MPSLFSRLKARDTAKTKKKNAVANSADAAPQKPKWEDAYERKTVEPEEIHELLRFCTEELKARALDHPFLLLPFRPTSDPSAVRTFVRHFFDQSMHGEALLQELRMTEIMVISGVTKWCWSRLQGGVVTWDAYELFKVGEIDSNMARDSFKTFIPISVENGARQRIIFDFFDLMAAIAAHSKLNGFGGRKLSRFAAWWAFEHKDTTTGFDGGYNVWLTAADATSHLFFAYLRSLSPEQNYTGISTLPMSLQKLLQETEYPPQRPEMMMVRTNRVVMIVDAVSPTPFTLLRRARNFQYRESDRALQEFSTVEDPVQALTEECRRVLKAISGANQSQVSSSKHSTSLRDASWSRFEDIGFTSALEEEEEEDESALGRRQQQQAQGLKSTPASGNGLARPTTPSWADFLSTGFVDDAPLRGNVLLPPDKVLPRIDTQPRQRSSQSHKPRLESDSNFEPGELASITMFDLDDSFWWVWMCSLAPEETSERKAAFGRCAVIETVIRAGRWLVMEEIISGAAPEPEEGAYIAEKKGFFSWTKRGKTLRRRKSTGKQMLEASASVSNGFSLSKTNIGPDTHAKIQAKAAQLRATEERERQAQLNGQRRGRNDTAADKTNSSMSLQPVVAPEAAPAMKWVSKYDKGAIKEAYMANSSAGRGKAVSPAPSGSVTPRAQEAPKPVEDEKPPVPTKEPVEVPLPDPTPAEEVPEPTIEVPETPAEESQQTELPVPEKEGRDIPASPVPPPKDDEPTEMSRQTTIIPETTEMSPESKRQQQKKLHKDMKEKAGFRKLFSRKNRASKLPENASADLKKMISKDDRSAAATPVQTKESDVEPSAEGLEPTLETSTADQPIRDPVYDPEEDRDLSRVNTQEADEAKREFARFDQGPLADQPGFAPDGEYDENDATPPPIARHPVRSDSSLASRHSPEAPVETLRENAGPGVQDRWAQIRKNAAERAAARQVEDRSRGYSRTTDGDDDTSGEETIESRVARIKARVAELTGTMDGATPGSPQNGSPSRPANPEA